MYPYLLALVFFVLGVNCAYVDDPALVFFEYLNTSGSLHPPEPDIEKIINSLNEIPQSSYQKAKEFLKNISSELKSYKSKNYVRQHVNNAATMIEFYEHVKSATNTEETAIIKQNMEQLGPKFAQSLAEIGQSTDLQAVAWQSKDYETEELQTSHSDAVLRSIRKLDRNIVEKLRSYCKEAVRELKESDIKITNAVFRHLSKIRIMIDLFEATGFRKPTEEFLADNPWIELAFDTVAPIFLQEMAYLNEFAKLIRETKSAAAQSQLSSMSIEP